MKKYRIMEIICIVILVLFIGILSKEETLSNKTVKEVAKAVTAAVNTEGLKKQKTKELRNQLLCFACKQCAALAVTGESC